MTKVTRGAQAYVAVDNQEHLDPEAFSKFLQHDVHRVRAPSKCSTESASPLLFWALPWKLCSHKWGRNLA